jgi:hypothetical protein
MAGDIRKRLRSTPAGTLDALVLWEVAPYGFQNLPPVTSSISTL